MSNNNIGEKTQCLNCVYWDRQDQQTDPQLEAWYASCRRYPPKRLSMSYEEIDGAVEGWELSEFPLVLENNWCGEWRQINLAPPVRIG